MLFMIYRLGRIHGSTEGYFACANNIRLEFTLTPTIKTDYCIIKYTEAKDWESHMWRF
jgi:hypothetical protein